MRRLVYMLLSCVILFTGSIFALFFNWGIVVHASVILRIFSCHHLRVPLAKVFAAWGNQCQIGMDES